MNFNKINEGSDCRGAIHCALVPGRFTWSKGAMNCAPTDPQTICSSSLSAWLSSTNLANAALRDSISASYTRDTTGQKKAHLHEETQFSRKVPPSNVKIV